MEIEKQDNKEKNLWEIYTDIQLKQLDEINEAYKAFLDAGKTERECVTEIVRQAETDGYRNLYEAKSLKVGDKVYATWMDKSCLLYTSDAPTNSRV